MAALAKSTVAGRQLAGWPRLTTKKKSIAETGMPSELSQWRSLALLIIHRSNQIKHFRGNLPLNAGGSAL
eukprot:s1754_g16.t1